MGSPWLFANNMAHAICLVRAPILDRCIDRWSVRRSVGPSGEGKLAVASAGASLCLPPASRAPARQPPHSQRRQMPLSLLYPPPPSLTHSLDPLRATLVCPLLSVLPI